MNLSFEYFSQAFDSLLRKLHKYVPYGTSVADLYAGAGVIGLSLAATRKCRSNTDSTFCSRSSSHSSINLKFLLKHISETIVLIIRSVKCVEVNKESKISFEKTAERLPVSVDSSISWHHADTSIVCSQN